MLPLHALPSPSAARCCMCLAQARSLGHQTADCPLGERHSMMGARSMDRLEMMAMYEAAAAETRSREAAGGAAGTGPGPGSRPSWGWLDSQASSAENGAAGGGTSTTAFVVPQVWRGGGGLVGVLWQRHAVLPPGMHASALLGGEFKFGALL